MQTNNPVKLILFLAYICCFVLLITLVQHKPVDTYLETLKQSEVRSQLSERDIEREIEELARKMEEPAINARIDRVWQAIPGYNGIQVDRERSLRFSKEVGQVNWKTLILQEIEPEISLSDLPPHPIYRGNPKKPMVAFMVNVAWGTEYLEEMLSIFDQYQVKATFFLDGKWLKEQEKMAKKILVHGHEIGNHAYSHPDLRKLSVERIREEIVKTEELINRLGTKSRFFAPPAGAYDQRVVQIAHEHQMYTVLWTLDTVDWQKPDAEVIVERIVPNLENGALILMHPTAPTVEALPRLIEGALEKELLPVTVSELISPSRNYFIERLE